MIPLRPYARPSARTRRRAVILTLLLVATFVPVNARRVAGQGPKTAQGTKPTAAPKPIITIKPDNNAPPDSVVKSQTFVVQAAIPAGQPAPNELTVTVDNADKYLNSTETVTVKKTGTAPNGSAVYTSEPIKIEGKAYWFDWITVKNGGVLTATSTINGQEVQSSFKVYDTPVKQAVGRNEDLIGQVKQHMTNTVSLADKVIPVLQQKIQAAQDGPTKQQLEADLKKATDAKALAQQKLQVIDQYNTMVHAGDANDSLPLYIYTDQYKFWVGKALIPFLVGSQPIDFRTDVPQAIQMATNNARNEITQIQFDAMKLLAIGLYQAVAELTLAGPVWTLVSPVFNLGVNGTWEGMTIYGTTATGSDYLHATTSLLIAAAMMKGLPLACDALGEAIAPGFKGRTPMFELSTGGGGKAAVKVADAQLETGLNNITGRAAKAKAAGADPVAVDAAVTEMATEVNANAGNPGAQMKAVAQADFDLAQLALRARNPSATLITDANQGILIRTVRAKAALEANGKPQTWTPQERMALIELANDGRFRNAYIVDDPFVTGSQPGALIDEFGFETVFTPEDFANVTKASRLNIKVTEPAPRVTPQPANQSVFDTVRLKPGENPYAIDRPLIDPRTGASQFQQGVQIGGSEELGGRLTLGELRAEVGARQAKAAGQSQRFGESPIREQAGKIPFNDYQVITPENLKYLTAEEIGRITPENIANMPARFQQALPVEKLNYNQLSALNKALGGNAVPAPEMPFPFLTDLNAFGLSLGGLGLREFLPVQNFVFSPYLPAITAPRPIGPAGAPIGNLIYEGPYGGARPGDVFAMDGGVKSVLRGKGLLGDFTVTRSDGSYIYTHCGTGRRFRVTEKPGGQITIEEMPLRVLPRLRDGFGFNPFDAPGFYNFGGGAPMNVLPVYNGVPIVDGVQLIIIIDDGLGIDFDVPEIGEILGTPAPQASVARRVVEGLIGWLKPRPVAADVSGWRVPARAATAQRNTAPGGLTMSIEATGASTGAVFKAIATNSTGKPASIVAPEGLVMQALRRTATPPPPLPARTGRVTKSIEGYCLEFVKDPPSAGTLYRVADPATQERFAPMRKVLSAANRLNALGLLHPDSDPKGYAEFVKQYAVWTRLNNWDLKKFADAFLERTKKNFAALRQPWTSAVEKQVQAAIPGRWRDLEAVLAAAASR